MPVVHNNHDVLTHYLSVDAAKPITNVNSQWLL